MNMPLVHVQRDSAFVLIKPGFFPHRSSLIRIHPDNFNLEEFLRDEPFIAIDFETTGNDITRAGFRAVGMGLASSRGIIYLDLTVLSDSDLTELYMDLVKSGNLISHNVQFDAGTLRVEMERLGMPKAFPFVVCTYGLYTQCANEGWPGQKWGLKEAMVDVLGWHSANDNEICEWLVANGYTTGSPPNVRADKGMMCKCPAAMLGKYCAADADACYLMFTKVLQPVAESFPELVEYHQKYYLAEVRMLIDAKLNGMRIDAVKLNALKGFLKDRISEAERAIYKHPRVGPAVAAWRQAQASKMNTHEPQRLTKKGKVSKSWETWNDKREAILDGSHPKIQFNINSDAQLRWLVYKHMFKTRVVAPANPATGKPGRFAVTLESGQEIEMDMSGSGEMPVSKRVLPLFGTFGQLMLDYNKAVKELEYVTVYCEMARGDRLYPGFKNPGTVTGRLAGEDPNVQQIPKIEEVMSCFMPDRDDWVLIDADAAALEQVVLAELSRDPALLQLYGPGCNPAADVYLHNARAMGSLGDKVKLYYDTLTATPESKKKAKQACEKERKIAKIVTLAKSYGAGAGKIYSTLQMAGVETTFGEAQDMCTGFDELYAGSKAYGAWLGKQWEANNGWVLNGIGRPMCVTQKLVKDVCNRVVQSTGHDILMIFLVELERLLNATGKEWRWFVPDFHDQTIIQCHRDDAQELKQCFVDAAASMNAILDGMIPIKMEPQLCPNLAAAKLEDCMADLIKKGWSP